MPKHGLWTAPVVALVVSCLPLQASLAQSVDETAAYVYVLQRVEKTKNAGPAEDKPGLIERSTPFSDKNRKLKNYVRATFEDGAISFISKKQKNIGARDNPDNIHFASEGEFQITYRPPPKIIRPGRDIRIPVSWSSSAHIGCDKNARILPGFSVLLYELRKSREKVDQENLRAGGLSLTREELKINCKTESTITKQDSGSRELVLKPSNEPPADAIVIRMQGPVTLGMLYHYKLTKPDEATVADARTGKADDEAAKDADEQAKISSFQVFDANPLYSQDKRTFAENWRATDLIDATKNRFGTSADGVSQLVVRAELSEPAEVRFTLVNNDDGSMRPLLGGKTVTLNKKHYSFALYTPPETFDGPGSGKQAPKSPLHPPKVRLGEVLQMRRVPVNLAIEDAEEVQETFVLARPPVVLVHGLFSDPVQTWVNTFADGSSMAALLERAGFLTFMVNYQNTNGTEKTGSWVTDDSGKATSAFADNRRVVWDSPRVDYRPVRYEYGYLQKQPIHSELQKPGWSRIGGIKQALTFYRDNLNLAATQAIVIGHSMGGLLARVWASDNYNADYRRPENFLQGDIDRLLTLNTPHHGSELVELKDALGRAVIDGEEWVPWARRKLVNSVVWWFLDPEPGAVTDLRPGSNALRRIGATRVPSYAIATKASSAAMGADNKDPFALYNALYSFAGMVFFNNRPLLDEFVLSRFRRWQNTADGFRKIGDWRGGGARAASPEENFRKYRETIAQNIDGNIYYWSKARDADFQEDLRRTIKNTIIAPFGTAAPSMGNDGELDLLSPEVLISNALTRTDVSRFFDDIKVSDVPDTFLTLLRDLVFHQDPETDGAVRVVSQIGGMGEGRHEIIDNVVHSYSPWDYDVQRRVLFLLKWEHAAFADEGIPAAGQLTPRYMPSTELSVARVEGEDAIAWSGMVASHAAAYQRVADEENVFILVRPVNQSSTALLNSVAAAKGMNVKGKSSNWGPQVGYIPFDQRYSKLWRIVKDPIRRNREIQKYNGETLESTSQFHPEKPGRRYAVKRPLTRATVHGECAVLTDPDNSDAESGVVFQCGDGFYDWRNGTRDDQPIFVPDDELTGVTVDENRRKRLLANPMQVLADDTSDLDPRPYLTADYDLLAIGYPFEAAQCRNSSLADCKPAPTVGVKTADYDPLRGYISSRQKDLLEKMNDAVEHQAGFTRGLVTHHGPETQYPKSPYVDYPILVFDPAGAEAATAYLVRQGPPGFRDIHLKRLFTEKNRLGYNLWPNPTSKAWRWEARRPFDMERGYDPRDASDLPPYVEEAPKPDRTATSQSVPSATAPSDSSPKPIRYSKPISNSGQNVTNATVGTPSPPGTEKGMRAGTPPEMETKLWSAMKQIGGADAPKIYLREYPNGHYVKEARQMLLDLATTPQIPGASQKPRKTTRCDELAASRWDRQNKTGITVNEWQLTNHSGDAVRACRLQVAETPDDLQSRFQLAMSLLASGENDEEAARILQYLADRRYPVAMALLADNFMSGYIVAKDEEKGKQLLLAAAEAGNKIARVGLAALGMKQADDPKDTDRLIADLRNEAADDNPLAYLFLGLIYSENRYDRKIPSLALKYFSLAEQNGLPTAMIALANFHERGDGVKKDLSEAIRWYTKAADAGHKGSREAIDRLRKEIAAEAAKTAPPVSVADQSGTTDQHKSPRERTPKSIRCDQLAALAHDPQNKTGLGVSTRKMLQKRNLEDAIDACRRALETQRGTPQSAFQLARALLLTYGPDETTEARKIIETLAANGYAAAMTEMGKLAADEHKDTAQAATWFLKAAILNDPEAMAEYALLGLVHNIPSVDNDEAFRLLKISLEQKFWKAFVVKAALHYAGTKFERSDRLAAASSIDALKNGGEPDAALWIKIFVETWKPEYRKFLQDLLQSEGTFDGTGDGDDLARTLKAIDDLALRHPDPKMTKPPAKQKAPEKIEKPKPAKPQEEAGAVWAIIQTNGSVAVLEEFVRHYPDSIYASLAKARIAELQGAK